MFPTQFTGASFTWERKKLGILITRVKSYPLSRSVEVKKETDVKYVHYGDIHTNIADEIDKNNNLPFINEIYKEYDELKLDDVIVADASEDYKGIADAAVIISNLPYTIIAGLHTIALRPTSLIKGYFLYHIFKTENFKRFGYKIGTGLKVFGISYNNLAKYKVYYPQKIEEQEKIIGILSNLTNSINLHERKCEELALIKKALLQKLFPKKDEFKPEVRYKNFSDAWEQRKLGEVASYRNGKAHEKDINESGKYIVINSKFVSSNGTVRKYSNKMIAPLNKGEISFVLSDVPNGKALARTFLIDQDDTYTLNQRIAGILPKQEVDPYFMSTLMNRNSYFLRFDDGVGQTNLSKRDVTEWNTFYPSHAEQKKIGGFLQQLDSLITLHQRKLEKLKQLKKFLLQNMLI